MQSGRNEGSDSFSENASPPKRGLLLVRQRQCGCNRCRRRTHGRRRRRHTCRAGAKAQELKRFCTQLPGGSQPMRLLEFRKGVHGRSVPFSVWRGRVRAIFSQRLLNFGNAFGSGGFLPSLRAGCLFCGFCVVRLGTGPCCGRL